MVANMVFQWSAALRGSPNGQHQYCFHFCVPCWSWPDHSPSANQKRVTAFKYSFGSESQRSLMISSSLAWRARRSATSASGPHDLHRAVMLRVTDCIADSTRPALPQPTEWQCVGSSARPRWFLCRELTRSAKPVGAWAGSQLWMFKGEQSGLLAWMATETGSSFAPRKTCV